MNQDPQAINNQDTWNKIRKHFSQAFASSLHVSVASYDGQSGLTVTPIGSMFLNDNASGFYFEMFPSKLPANSNEHPEIAVLAVRSSRLFWIRSLFKSEFSNYPAVKLYGVLGAKREAHKKEIRALQRRVRWTSVLQGHKYLWGSMHMVREIKFHSAEIIKLGKMTKAFNRDRIEF